MNTSEYRFLTLTSKKVSPRKPSATGISLSKKATKESSPATSVANVPVPLGPVYPDWQSHAIEKIS